MLKMRKAGIFISILLIALMLIGGCSNSASSDNEEIEENSDEDLIVVGFSQLGAESNWRSTNTLSMQETLTRENGYELIFEDGQQKQSNQFTAIRKFIQQEVDYIVLAPVTENGWDTVLEEAKNANIPVIIVDRMVNVSDENLFTCWVGSNFELEGKKAAKWLHEYTLSKNIAPEDIHIVDIQGTIGASAQIGRSKGLSDMAKEYGWEILSRVQGEFTESKGKEVMDRLLKQYDNINVVYCENDNEAFGAIRAIEEAGLTVGNDIKNGEIMVISFDGVNEEALNLVREGKIAVEAECNPLHGPRIANIIESLESGIVPEKYTYVAENIYSAYDGITKLTVDGAYYEVIILK